MRNLISEGMRISVFNLKFKQNEVNVTSFAVLTNTEITSMEVITAC